MLEVIRFNQCVHVNRLPKLGKIPIKNLLSIGKLPFIDN